jgi:5-hydroxyisourate hydrolase-like protein (transthyretin family)
MTINAQSFNHLLVSRRMVLSQDASVEFALSRGATIAGQVLAADGVTPMQAYMSLEGGEQGFGTSTDPQGRFELKNQAAGRYRVSAYKGAQVSSVKEVVVTEDQQLDGIKLVLYAAPMIRGTITGLAPAELQQLVVADVGAERAPDGRWWWRSNLFQQSSAVEIDGARYRLDPFGRGTGTVIVIAGPAPGPQVHKRITVPERGDASVDFDFAGGLQVAGRVTRAGNPVAGITMFALPDEGQPVAGFTQTTASGEYRFADLARGMYRISPANVKPVRLQMTGRVVQDFELPALEITGRVADAASGQPLSAVRVELRATQSDALTERRMARTDREGAFKLDQLAPGEYVLTLQRTGYDLLRQELALRASLENLSLQLPPAAGVRLRVRGVEVGRVSDVNITERAGAAVVAVIYVPLDVTGAGQIPPSLAGRSFSIDAPGHESSTVNNWDGAPLDVVLRPSRPR